MGLDSDSLMTFKGHMLFFTTYKCYKHVILCPILFVRISLWGGKEK